jgi:hypothetical protein
MFRICLASSKDWGCSPFKMPLIHNGAMNDKALFHHLGYVHCFGNGGEALNLWVSDQCSARCRIGDTYTVAALGATLSKAEDVAISAMEVWQLADA